MQDIKMFVNFYLQVFLLLIFSFYTCYSRLDSSNSDELHRTRKKENLNVENNNNDKNVELPRMSTMLNNSINENDNSAPVWSHKVNSTTVMEGFFIFAGLSVAVVLYFTVKAIRLRRRRCRVRKYGLLTSREDVEMTPLGEEEDDEDSTVFDINDHPHPSSRP